VLNAACNLGYTAATRVLTSDIGTDVTLPLMSSGDAGLVPASGGGTTNFLRADGTWANPPGGAGIADGDKGEITVASSGTVWTIDAGVVTNAKVASGIDAAKLADGSVSNTEYQYLNGVTSNVQTQLDSKLGAGAATPVTDTKAVPTGADGAFIKDVADSNELKETTFNGIRTTPPGTGLGTTGTVNLDFSADVGVPQNITLTGNITFTTSNLAAGRGKTLRVTGGGSTYTVTYPAGWKAFGATLPASLTAGQVVLIGLFANGTTDASVDAAAALGV
jgi:hypothetical protein